MEASKKMFGDATGAVGDGFGKMGGALMDPIGSTKAMGSLAMDAGNSGFGAMMDPIGRLTPHVCAAHGAAVALCP